MSSCKTKRTLVTASFAVTLIILTTAVGASADPLPDMPDDSQLQAVRDAFTAETVDTSWAEGEEQRIEEQFEAPEGAVELSEPAVKCHTSLCRLTVRVASGDPEEIVLFLDRVHELEGLREQRIEHHHDTPKGVLVEAYFSRTGFNLPSRE